MMTEHHLFLLALAAIALSPAAVWALIMGALWASGWRR